MPQRTPLPNRFAATPFTVAEALAAGLPRSRMSGSDLSAPYRGVRVPGSRPVHPVLAYSLRMPAHQYFSHETAARLWGLALPSRLRPMTLHVTAASPHRGPRVPGVTGHQALASRKAVTIHPGVRVSTVADTWRSLASALTLDELIVAGDSALRREKPLTTLEALVASTAKASGSRGARRAREALALVRARTDSTRETELRLMIVRSGLPEPVVNYEIRNEYGAFVAFGDLAYPEYLVLVEYDGGQHREDEKQFNRDIDRLDDVMELRWRVIRVNKSHVESRSASRLAKIRGALVERGWRP